MLAAPQQGFVFLAMPNTGSTAIESTLRPDAAVSFTQGALKHINMADFERMVVPLLAYQGFPRESYEVVCLFREPFDWVHSLWESRSRAELAQEPGPDRHTYTGIVTFQQFVTAYINRAAPYARVDGDSQSAFVRGLQGRVGVDRIFRYEHMDALVDYLNHRLQRKIRLDRADKPSKRIGTLSDRMHARLVAHLQPEYRVYEEFAHPQGAAGPRAPSARPAS